MPYYIDFSCKIFMVITIFNMINPKKNEYYQILVCQNQKNFWDQWMNHLATYWFEKEICWSAAAGLGFVLAASLAPQFAAVDFFVSNWEK